MSDPSLLRLRLRLPSSFFLGWLVASLCLWSRTVSGTALTYKLAPHEKACFYASAKTAGVKLAFYFAV